VVWWIARFWCRLRHLPQLRRLLRNSGELFSRRRSSLAEGEHTITFVSSIPFRFAVQSTVSWSFPSNPLCLLFLCMYCSSRRPAVCRPPSLPPLIPSVSTRPQHRWALVRDPLHLLFSFLASLEP
jgi:hypothetical protein